MAKKVFRRSSKSASVPFEGRTLQYDVRTATQWGGGGLKQLTLLLTLSILLLLGIVQTSLTLLSLNRKVRPRLSPRFRLSPRYR